jgi:hypothetical protein
MASLDISDTAGLITPTASETPFYGVLFDSASEFIAARSQDAN